MERVNEDYMPRLADVLTCVRSVNKTDSATVASNFGSLKALAAASREELALCPGLGGKKVERLFSALHAPFPGFRGRGPSARAGASALIAAPSTPPTTPPPLTRTPPNRQWR